MNNSTMNTEEGLVIYRILRRINFSIWDFCFFGSERISYSFYLVHTILVA